MLRGVLFRVVKASAGLLKEVWDTKFRLMLLIWYLNHKFLGSFVLFWFIMVKMPYLALYLFSWRDLARAIILLVLQWAVLLWMWKRFRRAQTNLPFPWREVDIDYVLQLIPNWGLLHTGHFVLAWFQSPRKARWHFRNTFTCIYVGLYINYQAKLEGPVHLVNTLRDLIYWEAFILNLRQFECVFRYSSIKNRPMLDYRHHPQFAYALLSQYLVILVLRILTTRGYNWPNHAIAVFPITVFATMLSFLLKGHEKQYLNMPLRNDELAQTDASGLCQTCLSTIYSETATKSKTHHKTARSLHKAAREGCRICSAAWQRRSAIEQDFILGWMFWKPSTTFDLHAKGVSIHFKEDVWKIHACKFEERERQVADRWAGINRMLDLRDRIAQEELPAHTGSEESLDLAVSWLQNCSIFHGSCAMNHDETFRPSRLLYVGDGQVRLHTQVEMPSKVFYLTLSHCWGKVHLLKLLRAYEDGFKRDIQWWQLPKTFQDAIKITRHLGFTYIWIDSLCIIQDSDDDWNREALSMGQIYKNAQCNIAASDAPDSPHGCLYTRDVHAIQPMPLDLDSDHERYFINESDIYDKHVLYTRAWVLQEALLAKRTIDCGKGQLFWRCAEMRASEVFPGGVPTNIYNDDHPASKFKAISVDDDQVILNANILEARLSSRKTREQLPRAPGKGSVQRWTHAPFAFWAAVVKDYTEMELTKDTDRAIAIAGITDVFRPHFGEHWFGMWRIFMPLELLWRSSSSRRMPSSIRAPTWSWLALEGAVSYVDCEFEYGKDTLLADFLGAEAVGETGMRLQLSARLLQATWTDLEFSGQAWLDSVEGATRSKTVLGVVTLPEFYGEVWFDVAKKDLLPRDVFCMPIQIHRSYMFTTLKGLILREVAPGIYARLGYFSDFRKVFAPLMKMVDKREIVLV